MTNRLYTCLDIKQAFTRFSFIRDCDVVAPNILRMSTEFLTPDGSYLDVFLQQDIELNPDLGPLFSGYVLSDLGETTSLLRTYGVKLWKGKERLAAYRIAKQLEVVFEEGQLEIPFPGQTDILDELPDAICRLAQACIRIATLFYAPLPMTVGRSGFVNSVQRFVEQLGLACKTGVEYPGRYGKSVEIDLSIASSPKESLVKMVHPKSKTNAHAAMNETFSRFYSLSNMRQDHQLITVIQNAKWHYRDDDIGRLKEVSDGVVFFPLGKKDLAALVKQ